MTKQFFACTRYLIKQTGTDLFSLWWASFIFPWLWTMRYSLKIIHDNHMYMPLFENLKARILKGRHRSLDLNWGNKSPNLKRSIICICSSNKRLPEQDRSTKYFKMIYSQSRYSELEFHSHMCNNCDIKKVSCVRRSSVNFTSVYLIINKLSHQKALYINRTHHNTFFSFVHCTNYKVLWLY